MDSIGDRLKQLRKEKGLTQQELAKEIGLSKSAIIQYENNKRTPNFHAMFKLERYFNVSSQYLSGQSDIRLMSIEMFFSQNAKIREFIIEHENTEIGRYVASFQNACNSLLIGILEQTDFDERTIIDQISTARDIEHLLNGLTGKLYYSNRELFTRTQLTRELFYKYLDNTFVLRMGYLEILVKQFYDCFKDKAYQNYIREYQEISLAPQVFDQTIDNANDVLLDDIRQFLAKGI